MQKSDRKQFAAALTQLFAVYGAELTERVLTAWWGVLSPYKLEAVLAAMNLHAGDVDRGMYKPTPADVRRHLERTLPAMLHERRSEVARGAYAQIAPLRERLAVARNDHWLGLLDERDLQRIADDTNREINRIMQSHDVALALSPEASLRDDEAHIAPRDRLPDVVRRALGWWGKRHA